MVLRRVSRAFVASGLLLAPTAVHADPFNNSAQTISGFGAVSAAHGLAVQDLQNQILSSGLEGIEVGVFPSGRLRKTWHDGYTGNVPPLGVPQKSNPFESIEESIFVTAFTTLPSQYFGGRVRLGAFVGYDHLHASMDAVRFTFNAPDAYFPSRADNDSVIFGGYALFARASNYFLATLSGVIGETDQKVSCVTLDASDPLYCQAVQPKLKPFSYDTRGVVGSIVGGHVLDLGRGPMFDALKLDLRAGTTVQYMEGGRFADAQGALNRPVMEAWGGSFAATLFAIVNDTSGATIRPYAKGEFRNSFYYNATNHVVDSIICASGCDIHYWQKSDMAVGEVGIDYAAGNYTVNAAFYGEAAADQTTLGGRIGVTFRTGSAPPPAKPSAGSSERSSVREEPVAGDAGRSWTGLYYGFNGGYGWSADDSLVTAQAFSLNNNALEQQSKTFGLRGTFGGAQAGYNWAAGRLVFGLEADVEGSQFFGSETVEVSEISGGKLRGSRVKGATEPDWFGTLRARLGYSFDRTLLYVTGGLAVGEIEDRISLTRLATGNDPATKIDRDTKTGYVLGAGFEHNFAPNWSLKAEYQYLDFGTGSVTIVDKGLGPIPDTTNGASFDHSYHTVRFGVNYHLGSGR